MYVHFVLTVSASCVKYMMCFVYRLTASAYRTGSAVLN